MNRSFPDISLQLNERKIRHTYFKRVKYVQITLNSPSVSTLTDRISFFIRR
ncbi:hypothetical protein P689_122253 [Candidatus Riesia pediculischaeffi PTSU]|uniref:Uncharacterized protein n=1 Tax=Candidatus Riesia pediculischaeffi PTSU TaxID=1401651 RepID=A0A0C1S930_9ENTR|nr:hypothetical protein P689_122253 [Candidatus Riesia pediculischaeffi PTSU]